MSKKFKTSIVMDPGANISMTTGSYFANLISAVTIDDLGIECDGLADFSGATRLLLPTGLSSTEGTVSYDNARDRVAYRNATNAVYLGPLVDQRTTDVTGINSTTLVTGMTVTLPTTGVYYFQVQAKLSLLTAEAVAGFAVRGTMQTSAYNWVSAYGGINSSIVSSTQASGGSGTTIPSATGGTVLFSPKTPAVGEFNNTRDSFAIISGTFTCSTAGTCLFQFSRTGGTGTISIKAGSIVRVEQVS